MQGRHGKSWRGSEWHGWAGQAGMSTDLAVRPGSDLAFKSGQTFFDEKQLAALRQLGVKDASNGDLAVFFHVCGRTGLDPFSKQIYMISRWTKDGPRQTIQTGIDGYRLIARRAAKASGEDLSYSDTEWCGPDGKWADVWLPDEHPFAVKQVIYRGESRFSAVALWREYVQTNKDGSPNSMWSRMAAAMLAKCAEAAVLRKAFPQDLSGIYVDEEMPGDDAPPPPTDWRLQNEPPDEPAKPATTRMSRAKKNPPPPPVDPHAQRPPTVIDVELPTDPEPPAPEPEVEGQLELPDEPEQDLPPDDGEMITGSQQAQMQILFREKGYDTRDKCIDFARKVTGAIELQSSKELTKREASKVIYRLEDLANVR